MINHLGGCLLVFLWCKGHKADACLNRKGRQSKMGTEKVVNQVECPVYVDSGAQVSMVDSPLIKPEQLLDETVNIAYADGKSVPKCLASIWVHFDSY